MTVNALGFLETRGLVAAIEAADAMAKAANVKLIRQHQVNPGFITIVVEGDLAACRAAVDAGKAAASKQGELVSRLEIGRPVMDTQRMVLELIERSSEDLLRNPPPAKTAPKAVPPTPSSPAAIVTEEISEQALGGAENRSALVDAEDDQKGVSEAKPAQQSSGSTARTAMVAVASGRESGTSDEVLVAFIAESPRGRTIAGLRAHFADPSINKVRLDEMVEKGVLSRTGPRYRIAGS